MVGVSSVANRRSSCSSPLSSFLPIEDVSALLCSALPCPALPPAAAQCRTLHGQSVSRKPIAPVRVVALTPQAPAPSSPPCAHTSPSSSCPTHRSWTTTKPSSPWLLSPEGILPSPRQSKSIFSARVERTSLWCEQQSRVERAVAEASRMWLELRHLQRVDRCVTSLPGRF